MSDQTMLELYLSQVTDPELRGKLQAEIEKSTKKFGLVFERHQPEGIRMPKVPVKAGSKVIRESDGTFHRVTSINGDTATLAEGDDTSIDYPVAGLSVAREFGDVMYPGLEPISTIKRGADTDPVHTVINGENYHALEMLQYTHAGKIDLIYIDPPYNTGNKTWKYNDRYVGEQDSYKHSKWLSFMEKRLQLAKELLTETGVVIVAIGDGEHHRLRMLLDQEFGESNFIANITWQGGGSALARHHAGGVDYMLIYGRNKDMVARFRDPKPFAPQMLNVVETALSSGCSVTEAEDALRSFIKAHSKNIATGLRGFNSIDALGRIYDTADLTNRLFRPNLKYPVTDPDTGRVIDPPDNGWAIEQGLMQSLISEARISFSGSLPRRKKYLTEYMSEMPIPTFNKVRSIASTHLTSIMGDTRFPNPKDHEVLMRWFRMAAPADAVILDFFGGSGTTAEAVMRLNAEDGGTRQSILVTNNELAAKDDTKLRKAGHGPGDDKYEALGVFRHVTKPRIETVVTGIREDGSTYSEGLAANVAFFNLTYLDAARVRTGLEFDALAGVFWLRAGAVGPLIERETLRQGYAVSEDAKLAVLFKPGKAAALAELLAEKDHPNLTHLFIVTESNQQGDEARAYFASHLEVERIYGSYLSSFQVNKKG
ncbi:site-specific DNA-methyltransferase [Arthrobacter sp. A2-55]|uniref:site-specific DNA-methyltransferase n=1 Tax=Arthrobacter sp. A2-55 TaxID=2897337 RepID=UPI0021CDBB75|nr:site-specific DNA-methyltransferase [Arthrobacter sp. A2-55]MCU6480545.1 site-specific DNA-methyltransferase [Arthrobacter sp. A2-55]